MSYSGGADTDEPRHFAGALLLLRSLLAQEDLPKVPAWPNLER